MYYRKPLALWRGVLEVAYHYKTIILKSFRSATAMAEVETKNVETLAYLVHGAGEPFKLEQVTLDELAADELLVDIEYSGICATDLGFQAGKIKLCPYPAIFGHEGAGKILAIGAKVQNKNWKVGDRVLLSMNYCQKCKFCKSEHPADCVEGTRLHLFGLRDNGTTAAKLNGTDVRFHFFGQSSFAKRSFVHETCVVKVPEGVKDEDIPSLAAMGCGYQTGIYRSSYNAKEM
jgi:Zn-dependent alcohol dehydrogenase